MSAVATEQRGAPRRAELAAWLRSGLDSVPRRYNRRWVLGRTRLSASTIAAAVSGNCVPTWKVAEAIALTCRLDGETTARLWRAARAEREGHAHPADPDAAGTAAEFGCELRALLLHTAGLTGVRGIAEATGLSRSAVGRALKGDSPPASPLLEAMLRPCGISAAERRRWVAARARLVEAPVPDEPVVGSRALLSDADALTTAVHRDLQRLGRGRGLRRSDVVITPTMSMVCGINPTFSARLRLDLVTLALAQAAEELPGQAAHLVMDALGIDPPGPRPAHWANATDLMFVTHDMKRDLRLLRREVDQAKRLLAAALVGRYLQGRVDAAV
ncbi:helix-turn-helix domain-containing protein [Actinokineospora sp. NPDC004072]